jgi:hypothetical protein
MPACTRPLWTSPVEREPLIRLVYERTAPPGVDAGIEPLIAVCATEAEAEQVKAASTARGHYASWETLPVHGAAGTGPLTDGTIVHLVLLGGGEADPERDPIGVAVYSEPDTARRRARQELRQSGDPGHHVRSLPIGWRADSPS